MRKSVSRLAVAEIGVQATEISHVPLGDFTADNAALDLGRLRAVSFVFDRVHAGEVSIDQIGFSNLPSDFLSARVDGR